LAELLAAENLQAWVVALVLIEIEMVHQTYS
jgi:hypothetical protein